VSDFECTENQINNLLRKVIRNNEQGWMDTSNVRTENMKASNVRRLMKIMVDRGFAFDNWLSPDNERYAICFNLLMKDRMLEDLDRFDPALLSHLRIVDISPEYLSKLSMTADTHNILNISQRRYAEIYDVLCMYQDGKDIDKFKIDIIDREGQPDKFYSKYFKRLIIAESRLLIDMYKSIKVGWREIEEIVEAPTYNDLFLELLSEIRLCELDDCFNIKDELELKVRSKSRYLKEIANINESCKNELSKLIKYSIDLRDKEFYQSLLEDCIQYPYGRSLQNAVSALCKLANRDTSKSHITDKLNDIINAYHAVSTELPINDSDSSYIKVLLVEDILGISTDPRIRKALSDWKSSKYEASNILSSLYYYFTKNPDERL
jgi:hypothetical protein